MLSTLWRNGEGRDGGKREGGRKGESKGER